MSRVPRIIGAGWKNKTRTGKVERIQISFTQENLRKLNEIAESRFKDGKKYVWFDLFPNTRRQDERAPEFNLTAYVEDTAGEDDITTRASEILGTIKKESGEE